MSDKPPFDTTKACFYLIAAILAFQCSVVAIAMGWCVWNFREAIELKHGCDMQGKLSELLSGALAAALAFAGGFSRKDK
jgi:hypothetical protein